MSTGELLLCFVIFIVALGLWRQTDEPHKFDGKKHWQEKERKWKNNDR